MVGNAESATLNVLEVGEIKKQYKMKIRILIHAIICTIVLSSCTSEEKAYYFENDDSPSLVAQLNNVVNNHSSDANFIRFDLSHNENDDFLLLNQRTITKNRFSEAFWNLKKQNKSISIKFQNQTRATITVCCTLDGNEYDCVTCPDGAGQNLCIIQAINACTDKGGCAVTCENTIIYNPYDQEFFIVAK